MENDTESALQDDLALFDSYAAQLRTVVARLFKDRHFILRRYDSVIGWLRGVAVDADDF